MSSRYLIPAVADPARHGLPELVLLIGEVPDDEAADQDAVGQHRAAATPTRRRRLPRDPGRDGVRATRF